MKRYDINTEHVGTSCALIANDDGDLVYYDETLAEINIYREALDNLLTAIRGGGCSSEVWDMAIENCIRHAEEVLRREP